MENFKEQEIQKRNGRYYRLFDLFSGLIFGTLIALGIVFLVRLLLLKP